MDNKILILKIQKELRKVGVEAGELEDTINNYDNLGLVIKEVVPTITTSECEIGSYDNILYFTYIFDTSLATLYALEKITEHYSDIHIYGYQNFLKDFYSNSINNNNLSVALKGIQKEKYFQIQKDFDTKINLSVLIEFYLSFKNLLYDLNIIPVNQLKLDSTKL